MPRLTPARLEQLAQLSGGRFAQLRQDQQDILYLSDMEPLTRDGKERDDQQGDAWYDLGPWLLVLAVLALLPLARRGVLLVTLISVVGGSQLLMIAPVAAQQSDDDNGLAWHQQLWQTPINKRIRLYVMKTMNAQRKSLKIAGNGAPPITAVVITSRRW
ncbi:hypothetical protein [Pseudidiomarina halophila]|uniref:hypothetical protein n=1 Tax=Pseudidiomarina halophila TaxID=1449799 RepID=UPI00360F4157